MDTNEHQNISAYILAGGQSRRFGEDKALVSHKGRPLIAHVWEAITGCFELVSIVAKPGSPYRSLGYPVVDDILPGQSPLIGIYTGLLDSETDWVFFTACDMPFLTCKMIHKMISVLDKEGDDAEIIVPVSPQGLEPLAALYHRSLVHVLSDQKNTLPLQTFIRSRKYIPVYFETVKPFTNVNTKEQFDRIDR